METKMFSDISDTARWVAYYRALESKREDALFKDPFAEMLAGKRGEEIVNSLPSGLRSAWSLAIRTVAFDELILKTVSSGNFKYVINLASGLDSRPYRLPLPEDIHWIEVDFPEILDSKIELMQQFKPTCALQHWKYDLSNADMRKEMYAKINDLKGNVFIISEGLICYLEEADVKQLSEDIFASSNIKSWLFDLFSPLGLKMLNHSWRSFFNENGAHLRFGNYPAFFENSGWKVVEKISVLEQARRYHREVPIADIIKEVFETRNQDQNDFYRFLLLSKN